MARNAAKAGALDSNGRLKEAVALLVALSSSPCNEISASSYMLEHAISVEQLDEVVALLNLVADSNTGARVVLSRQGDTLRLEGSAGQFDAVRLTEDEALALASVLERFRIADDARERVKAALAPLATVSSQTLLTGDPLFGGFYQLLCEALVVGARLEITYQSLGDNKPVTRVVDPGFFMVAGDAAYLVAWDIAKDGQRSYRLDRISHVEMTDESVVNHAFVREGTKESLGAMGLVAILRFSSRALFERCPWEGLHGDEAAVSEIGEVTAPVSYTSKPWLFDQILAAGGSIELVEPVQLRSELVSYARELLS